MEVNSPLQALLMGLEQGGNQANSDIRAAQEQKIPMAIQQYQLLRQVSDHAQAEEERQLRMAHYRMQMAKLDADMRQAQVEASYTPERRAEIEKQKRIDEINALAAAQWDNRLKEIKYRQQQGIDESGKPISGLPGAPGTGIKPFLPLINNTISNNRQIATTNAGIIEKNKAAQTKYDTDTSKMSWLSKLVNGVPTAPTPTDTLPHLSLAPIGSLMAGSGVDTTGFGNYVQQQEGGVANNATQQRPLNESDIDAQIAALMKQLYPNGVK